MPSAVIQIGSLLALAGASLFFLLTTALLRFLKAGVIVDDLSDGWLYVLIICVSMMGGGFSPQYAMVQASMRQHGEMTSQEQGFFFTAASLGVLVGLWLPGLVSLPLLNIAG